MLSMMVTTPLVKLENKPVSVNSEENGFWERSYAGSLSSVHGTRNRYSTTKGLAICSKKVHSNHIFTECGTDGVVNCNHNW